MEKECQVKPGFRVRAWYMRDSAERAMAKLDALVTDWQRSCCATCPVSRTDGVCFTHLRPPAA